jgi:hypothetical protein
VAVVRGEVVGLEAAGALVEGADLLGLLDAEFVSGEGRSGAGRGP